MKKKYFITDINFLLKQYEALLKSADENLNSKKILEGTVICEYMLNLGLKKKEGSQFKVNTQLNQIIIFAEMKNHSRWIHLFSWNN